MDIEQHRSRGLRGLGLVASLLLAAPLAVAAPGDGAQKASPKAQKPIVLEGELPRAEVAAIVERGPQPFIASLRVAPHLEGRRFVGFRIEGFAPDSPLINSRAIQPGDVVLAVNREPLERPEQFMRAWELVARKDTLEVDLLRAGQRLRYRWTLVP